MKNRGQQRTQKTNVLPPPAGHLTSCNLDLIILEAYLELFGSPNKEEEKNEGKQDKGLL